MSSFSQLVVVISSGLVLTIIAGYFLLFLYVTRRDGLFPPDVEKFRAFQDWLAPFSLVPLLVDLTVLGGILVAGAEIPHFCHLEGSSNIEAVLLTVFQGSLTAITVLAAVTIFVFQAIENRVLEQEASLRASMSSIIGSDQSPLQAVQWRPDTVLVAARMIEDLSHKEYSSRKTLEQEITNLSGALQSRSGSKKTRSAVSSASRLLLGMNSRALSEFYKQKDELRDRVYATWFSMGQRDIKCRAIVKPIIILGVGAVTALWAAVLGSPSTLNPVSVVVTICLISTWGLALLPGSVFELVRRPEVYDSRFREFVRLYIRVFFDDAVPFKNYPRQACINGSSPQNHATAPDDWRRR